MVWSGRCSEPQEPSMDLCWALGAVTWEPTAAAGRRCWFCWGMSCRWLRCRIHGLPVTTSQRSSSRAFQGCQAEPWAVPRQLGQAAGTVSSGTCWPCPSECTVPSPASLLPKALQAVAELLHREHPDLLPTACHTQELLLDFCNQPQSWLLQCKGFLHVGFM